MWEGGEGRSQSSRKQKAEWRREAGRHTVGVYVALACCLQGSGARGCPDLPAVVASNDDLNVGECTRVDAHDVRALPSGRARGSVSSSRSSSIIITAVRHDDDEG